MQWSNVKLIYLREMRDQFRDRRTLFLIAILPLLLYPLLGMSFFQLAQFLRFESPRVLLLGEEELAGHDWLPPLLGPAGDRFAAAIEPQIGERGETEIKRPTDFPALYAEFFGDDESLAEASSERLQKFAQQLLDSGRVQAVVWFPNRFGESLETSRQAVLDRSTDVLPELPQPLLLNKSANEKSRLAMQRLQRVLENWRSLVSQANLSAGDVPQVATQPFQLKTLDLAPPEQKRAAVWAKLLPFIVFIWALTGAFYPAVDLCAGEKERGTLETLLTSPALRREIVWGKLLTVMSFSIATAVLNLGSLGVTAKFVMGQFAQIGGFGADMPMQLPSPAVMAWLILALVPISALFSALCLACAALARSTKEGQYYLMPLMLVTMPLMMLPMSPGVELNLGNSLIPLTGLVLLLKSVLEGQYFEALRFVVPVAGVTLMAALLAIRWAEEQFNRESVLFRESERLELGRWLVHLVRDRRPTPSVPQAMLCIAVILVVQFFISVAARPPAEGLTFGFVSQIAFISQAVCILMPALLMTLLFTSNRRRTLLLDSPPRPTHIVAAMLMAIVAHPLVIQLGNLVQSLYPMSPEIKAQTEGLQAALGDAPYWWLPFLLIAVMPAFCEEIAFRGFILSGLRHVGHKWWAICLSAVAFGAVHTFMQQKISAAVVGVLIGYLAVQSGSLWTCVAYHFTHNGLQLLSADLSKLAERGGYPRVARWYSGENPLIAHPATLTVCAVALCALLWAFHHLVYRRTDEERLQEARERSSSHLVGAS
ncbi:MAG: CPBP family intramembrane metalloprotease domain-containing protein [Planctomycetaceae bacterium]|nr:CPBP family intramembrane metalloprotease domain-containing protein [Planctomycetaceae bacterium]